METLGRHPRCYRQLPTATVELKDYPNNNKTTPNETLRGENRAVYFPLPPFAPCFDQHAPVPPER